MSNVYFFQFNGGNIIKEKGATCCFKHNGTTRDEPVRTFAISLWMRS